MVCFGSTSETSTEMRKYSRDLRVPEAETIATGLKQTGFIQVATDADRLGNTAAFPPSTVSAASTCRNLPDNVKAFPTPTSAISRPVS